MQIIKQNILEIKTGIIVQSVNCRGVMGSGLAKQIRDKWPRVYEQYVAWMKHGGYEKNLGCVQLVTATLEDLTHANDILVCNLAGQNYYGLDKQYTDYDAIRTGLTKLNTFVNKWIEEYKNVGRSTHNFQIYIPYNLGCGRGGGDWSVVSKIIEETVPTAIVCQFP